jgi:Xaa-Pro aminopeptidase
MILSELETSFRTGGVGVEQRRMTVELWEELAELLRTRPRVDITEHAIEARGRKDSWEVAQVTKAAALAQHALRVAEANATERVSELDLQALMVRACAAQAKLDCPGDTVQVNFNCLGRPRLAALHALARADRLPADGVGFLLANVRVNGYWADLARTFFLRRVGEEAREAYEVATIAQQEALKMVAPAVPVRGVVAKIDGILERTKFRGMRRFRAIRGLGLETSEHPYEDGGGTFERRNLFTLQCYIVGHEFAVGRSDTVLVTETGARCLTSEQS